MANQSIQPDFPFELGASGYFKTSTPKNTIPGRIIQLLYTDPGERVMLADFGVGIRKFLFEPMDTYSVQKLRRRIMSQMSKYEPSLKIESLQIIPMSDGANNQIYVKMIISDAMSYNEKFEFGHQVI